MLGNNIFDRMQYMKDAKSISPNVRIRLHGDELIRLNNVYQWAVHNARGKVELTAVVKELMGLLPNNLINDNCRLYLAGKADIDACDRKEKDKKLSGYKAG
jgi:hypothetical protein